MRKTILLTLASVAPLLWIGAGCSHSDGTSPHDHAGMMGGSHGASWGAIHELIAVIHPTDGNQCSGVVRFTEENGKVRVVADFAGLNPNQQHAIHIHEFGDCSLPNGTSAGGHYNPESQPHALPGSPMRHAGDLGNLQADANGKAHYELTVENITLAGLRNPIIGRGVIVHAKADDGGQPTGNADGRIGCGVIGIAKPPAG